MASQDSDPSLSGTVDDLSPADDLVHYISDIRDPDLSISCDRSTVIERRGQRAWMGAAMKAILTFWKSAVITER